MRYPGFCGPSNPSQSLIADCERTINWYYERIESPFAPTDAALYPTPGQQIYIPNTQITDVGARGGISVAGRSFVVYGPSLYEIFQTKTATKRGTVAQDNNPATVSYNGATGGQLFITSGGNGYCFTLATNTLTQIAALNGLATQGGFASARFLAFSLSTGLVYMSDQNDGLTWSTGTLFLARTLSPDPWQAMIINPPDIYLIGTDSGEVWRDVGSFPQPFAPVDGASFKIGIASTFSIGIAGDSVTWLSRSVNGAGPIVAARGYSPQPISNFAVDTAIAGYARMGSIADTEVLVYEDQGHLFAGWSFLTGKRTHVYDFTLNVWHERSTRLHGTTTDDYWHPRMHLFAFNKHLVGDRSSAYLSELDVTFGSEANGDEIRRVRIAPPLYAQSGRRGVVGRLTLFAEPGLGLSSGQGSDPVVMLRTSPDAKTWSSERRASAGKLGQYSKEVFWTRPGSSTKLWVPEIVVTDPIPWRLAGADLQADGFEVGKQQAA